MKSENKKKLFLLGKVLLAIITSFVLGNLISIFIEFIIPSNSISTPISFLVGGGHQILAGLISIALFVKTIDIEKFFTSNWFLPKNRVKEFFIGGLLGSICIFLGLLIIINLNWSQVEIVPLRLNYLLSSFFLLFCGAFFEKLVFRGYVLRKLLERFRY